MTEPLATQDLRDLVASVLGRSLTGLRCGSLATQDPRDPFVSGRGRSLTDLRCGSSLRVEVFGG
ncbi:hypothetical protein GCM10010112_21290 [Actinoplanes lobatus]|uniref:Uncharacterized protein n=1 Tax=Actinoplanes lobatus TaxID=113568 RepID=A0ABQ4AHR2_9ACTN|nr:hypothetical protein GCM10010112_21290 [Actinoplanes lobatus]GIE40537.1 hypothetical protein Alo02nite_34350 [Actinoplanes lobatus]